MKEKVFKDEKDIEIFRRISMPNVEDLLDIEIEIKNLSSFFNEERVMKAVEKLIIRFARMVIVSGITTDLLGDWSMLDRIDSFIEELNKELTLF